VERLYRTLLDRLFRIQGRQKWYASVEEMRTDLEGYCAITIMNVRIKDVA
jgi:hypothetical protein